MVPSTRRALLYGAAGLATGLAGCNGLLDGSAESTRTALLGHRFGSQSRTARTAAGRPQASVTTVDHQRVGSFFTPTDFETETVYVEMGAARNVFDSNCR